jgi:hypothetical protein
MLSDLQQKSVWEGWLSSEIRSNYFADLCYSYQRRQRVLSWLILAFSSGAFASVVIDWIPADFGWIKAALAFLTVALSLWLLIAQNQKSSTDCSDLHFRWNRLAAEYQTLWDHMYSDGAAAQLETLTAKSAELSKSGTVFPNKPKLMEKWQDHVVRHHAADAAT